MSSLVAGARFSNYTAWLTDPFGVKPAAKVVYSATDALGDVFNPDSGSGSAGLRITSGVFSVWHGAGITCISQLFAASTGFLVLSVIFSVAGWYHHHLARPEGRWFNDTEAVLIHHLTAVLGLGSVAWCGHLIHVALPVDGLLRLGMDPSAIPLDLVSLNSCGGISGAAHNLLGLDWHRGFTALTLVGGLSPMTGCLWTSDVAHHHLALGTVSIVARHILNQLASAPIKVQYVATCWSCMSGYCSGIVPRAIHGARC